MTKAEFLSALKALYRVGNLSDSDSPFREDWTKPAMADKACCQHLDAIMRGMLEAGVIDGEEFQAVYETI